MKLYKDGASIDADKAQIAIMEGAGWSRVKEEAEVEEKSTDTAETDTETSKKKSVKKIAKRRKPIAKIEKEA